MGIRFEPRALGQTHVDVRFTCVRGHEGRGSERYELDPALLTWTTDASDGSETIELAKVLERIQKDKVKRIVGLFGVGDAEKARSFRREIAHISNNLCVDVTDELARPAGASAARIRTALRNTCNLPDSFDSGLKNILKYSPPTLFLFDLTGKDAAEERKPWCTAITEFMREHGSATDGEHHAIVILPHRHRFNGQQVENYFDDATWLRTDPLPAGDYHPKDDDALAYQVEPRVIDRTHTAVHRHWLKQALQQPGEMSSSSLVLVRGGPGTGKTFMQTKLCDWFAQPGDVVAVRGFRTGTADDPDDLLQSLCYDLLWRFGWDGDLKHRSTGDEKPDRRKHLARCFQAILQAAANWVGNNSAVPIRRQSEWAWEGARRLVIGIDGIDECRADPVRWLRETLPDCLPEKVHIVISSRPGFIDRLNNDRPDATCISLSPTDHAADTILSGNVACDVEEYIRVNLSPPSYVGRVRKAAQNNFLCAVLIIDYIYKHANSNQELEGYLERLEARSGETIKSTFAVVFDDYWNALTSRAGVEDDRELRRRLRKIMEILVTARRAVSARMLGELTGLSVDDVGDLLADCAANGLVEEVTLRGEPVCQITLQVFREYLVDPGVPDRGLAHRPIPADPQECHSRLGKWCLDWDEPGLSEADYLYRLRQAVIHLREGQEWESLYQLLVGPTEGWRCGKNFEYLVARMTENGGPHGLVDDFRAMLGVMADDTIRTDDDLANRLRSFATVFIGEQHTFADQPELCFSQMYAGRYGQADLGAFNWANWYQAVHHAWRNEKRAWLRRIDEGHRVRGNLRFYVASEPGRIESIDDRYALLDCRRPRHFLVLDVESMQLADDLSAAHVAVIQGESSHLAVINQARRGEQCVISIRDHRTGQDLAAKPLPVALCQRGVSIDVHGDEIAVASSDGEVLFLDNETLEQRGHDRYEIPWPGPGPLSSSQRQRVRNSGLFVKRVVLGSNALVLYDWPTSSYFVFDRRSGRLLLAYRAFEMSQNSIAVDGHGGLVVIARVSPGLLHDGVADHRHREPPALRRACLLRIDPETAAVSIMQEGFPATALYSRGGHIVAMDAIRRKFYAITGHELAPHPLSDDCVLANWANDESVICLATDRKRLVKLRFGAPLTQTAANYVSDAPVADLTAVGPHVVLWAQHGDVERLAPSDFDATVASDALATPVLAMRFSGLYQNLRVVTPSEVQERRGDRFSIESRTKRSTPDTGFGRNLKLLRDQSQRHCHWLDEDFVALLGRSGDVRIVNTCLGEANRVGAPQELSLRRQLPRSVRNLRTARFYGGRGNRFVTGHKDGSGARKAWLVAWAWVPEESEPMLCQVSLQVPSLPRYLSFLDSRTVVAGSGRDREIFAWNIDTGETGTHSHLLSGPFWPLCNGTVLAPDGYRNIAALSFPGGVQDRPDLRRVDYERVERRVPRELRDILNLGICPGEAPPSWGNRVIVLTSNSLCMLRYSEGWGGSYATLCWLDGLPSRPWAVRHAFDHDHFLTFDDDNACTLWALDDRRRLGARHDARCTPSCRFRLPAVPTCVTHVPVEPDKVGIAIGLSNGEVAVLVPENVTP